VTAPDARRRGAAGAGPARVVHSRRTRLGPRTRAGVRGGRGESICTWLRGGGGSRVGCCSQSGAARYWGDRASRRPRRGSAKAAAQSPRRWLRLRLRRHHINKNHRAPCREGPPCSQRERPRGPPKRHHTDQSAPFCLRPPSRAPPGVWSAPGRPQQPSSRERASRAWLRAGPVPVPAKRGTLP
jgi:hypothetical protein